MRSITPKTKTLLNLDQNRHGLQVVFYCLAGSMCIANLLGYLLPKDAPAPLRAGTGD